MSAKKLEVYLTVGLLGLYGLLTLRKIDLVTADLGRHLKNGETIVKTLSVPKTNFYSFSYPDYPFINHHWGSGVIFYLVQKISGFGGLAVFATLFSVATFFLFFLLGRKRSDFSTAFLVSLLIMPVLASRIEIRPEIFSYFLTGVFWWILSESWHQKKLLWLLPFLELIWVNLHIYFFLGLFLIGVFFLQELITFLRQRKDWTNLRHLAVFGFLSLTACLVNPSGIKGLLYPLQIFNNFGYRLFENQSVWFLDRIVQYPPSLYFKIAFGVLVVSWIYLFWKRKTFRLSDFLISIFVSYAAWTAVRNFALFSLLALPIIAANFSGFINKSGKESALEYLKTGTLAFLILVPLFFLNPHYWEERLKVRVGVQTENLAAITFFKKNNLKGPIFNNYDNGGYLIYFLYPEEKVFIDNRPEAYPASFINKTYIPMQEDEKVWQEMEEKYRFNVIFFYREDLTPWGQNFLVGRIKDSSWAPVFVDNWSIIFLKRNEENKKLIQEFELPKEMFAIKQ